MALNRKRVLVDEWTADKWYREFFSVCLLPEACAEGYAVIFAKNGMRSDMLPLLDRDLLKEMKIDKVGHMIEILRVAQEVSSQEQRSEITRTSKPTPNVQSKVVNLKSVVIKDSRQRKESEVGGIKRDLSGIKRPVPDEGPTLSVKMPCKMKPAPTIIQEDDSQSFVRPNMKDRTSAQSVEVSSSTEKKPKKSVFERLGTVGANQPNEISPPGGILKKNFSSQSLTTTPVKYGPAEMPKPLTPYERKRLRSPGRLVLNNSGIGAVKPIAMPQTVNHGATSSRQRSLSPGPSSKQANLEPSFHVTMSMKLSNPLVTKISNGHLNKKQQERRNFSPSVIGRSNSAYQLGDTKQLYGSMAADQVELSKDLGAERALKQRLGSKGNFWSKEEIQFEKKRVSFGNVRTKEIPAVPGTQPINPNSALQCKQIYSGSVALRTAKKL